MTTARRDFTRRQFLGVTATSAAVAAMGQVPHGFAADPDKPKRKTILSFYCDDTSPSRAGAKAFQTFLDYCAEQGIKGESSLILGMGGRGSISPQPERRGTRRISNRSDAPGSVASVRTWS